MKPAADPLPASSSLAEESTASTWQRLRALPASVVVPLAVVLCVAVALFIASEWSYHSSRATMARLAASGTVEQLAQRIRTELLDAEASQRGYLLTNDTAYLAAFDKSAALLPELLVNLRNAVDGDPEMRAIVASLEVPIRAKLERLSHSLALAREGRRGEALRIIRDGEGIRLMAEAGEQFARLNAAASQRAVATSDLRTRDATLARGTMLATMLVTIALILIALRMMTTELRRREKERDQESRQRRELEAEVAARTEELSSLSTHLQTVAEVERSTLAKELHDELGGLLTAAKMDMAYLTGRLNNALDAAGEEKLRSLAQMLNQAMTLKRRVVENLRPSLLDHFGLPVALRSHFDEQCGRAGIEYVATMPDEMSDLPPQTLLALFRVAQEALANALARGDTKHVELVIESAPGGYTMEVGDDGTAANAGAIAHSVNGTRSMLGMRHRVESARGTLKVAAVPGQGNRITVFVPRSPEESG